MATGAQTDLDVMGNVADAKACFIERIAGDGEFTINAGDQPVTLGASSLWLWFNPAGGLTSLTLTTPGDAIFQVYLFS